MPPSPEAGGPSPEEMGINDNETTENQAEDQELNLKNKEGQEVTAKTESGEDTKGVLTEVNGKWMVNAGKEPGFNENEASVLEPVNPDSVQITEEQRKSNLEKVQELGG